MRYYDLDINGKVKGSYAVPQPDKVLHLLEDAPDESKRDGVPGTAWIPDTDIIDVRLAGEAKATLLEIDLKSIRSIREYIAAKPDAPEYLKTYEAQAVAERDVITK